MIAAHGKPGHQPPSPDEGITDAAINAAAVASLAYQLERERFRYVITLGLQHGTPLADLAQAAGLTCAQAVTLVNEGEL